MNRSGDMQAKLPQNRRLLSVKEAAERYCGSPNLWRERIWRGEIPVVKIGRKHFLDVNDIERFITTNKVSYVHW